MEKVGIRCSLGGTGPKCQDNFLTEKQQSIGHLRLQLNAVSPSMEREIMVGRNRTVISV